MMRVPVLYYVVMNTLGTNNLADIVEEQLPEDLLAFILKAGGLAHKQQQRLYMVGGAVRDLLIERPTLDIDLVIEGDAIKIAEEMAKINGAEVTVHTRFGTASLRWRNRRVDVATARAETYERPGALPSVKPGTIAADLARRDFTINAMAVELNPPHFGELIDLHQGQKDIENRLIRVLHAKSFIDDATRIWRAARYEQRLDFTIEPATLVLIKRDIDNLRTIRGALQAAEKAGQVMLVLETSGEPARESEAIAAALDRQVDGIIFASMRAREVFVPDLPFPTPVVMLNATNPRFPASVLPDELEGGRSAVRLLRGAGFDSGIVLLGQSDRAETGLFRSETVSRRIRGVRSEMKRHRLEFVAEESCWNWEPEEGYRLARKLLKGRHPIRAILCMNDRLAFGVYQALADAGLKVPDDVSIVSFDNDELAAYLRPGLTTIGLPHDQMGRLSVELLLSGNVEGEHLVPMPVIERGSIRAVTR